MGVKSYLTEREYIKNDNCNNTALVERWKKLLGEDVYNKLIQTVPEFQCYLREEQFTEQHSEDSAIAGLGEQENHKIADPDIFFPEFYNRFLKSATARLKRRLKDMEAHFSQDIYEDFEKHLVGNFEKICLRTLIVEMHLFKDNGWLQGADSKEEYEYFCRKIVGTAEFGERLREQYPVMFRCIGEKAEQIINYYQEIIVTFAKEKKEIGDKIFDGEVIKRITRLRGNFSDVHKNGKQVLHVRIDDNKDILYKPHSMENERIYQELLEWMEEQTHIRQYSYPFLSYENHSWCKIVEYQSCESEKQLSEYYRRLGVQLFLAYMLGTKDLHCENLIACGEYPVLIDLETLIQVQGHKDRHTVGEEICYQLSESVLYTGMLPLYHWNNEGTGVNSSAISGAEGQSYPFRVPTVLNAKTSEMRIGYYSPISKNSQNLATVKGEFQSPAEYKGEMLEGFTEAYRHVMLQKEEFRSLLDGIANTPNRFLVADTQRYSMVLSSSYHPSLLMDGADREIFLYSMWKGRQLKEREIVKSEVKDLLRGDIPYFYYNVSETGLYSSDGKVIEDYFAQPAITAIYHKLDGLNNQDLVQQCEYICLAIELMPQEKESFTNRVYYVDENVAEGKAQTDKTAKKSAIEGLRTRLLRHAVWNQDRTEVSWFTTSMYHYNSSTWKIKPMNYYLYDGLAGMLLVTYELGEEKLYETLRDMLFRYTLSVRQSSDKLISGRTGMYDGESSIVFAYLLMYCRSNDEEYLKYAKKHARIVERLLGGDGLHDLVSGNAGAAWVLLQLYRITEDKEYLKMAEDAIAYMTTYAQKQQTGIGWLVEKNCPPLAGMAHGNSGILMPLLSLWELTGEDKYEKLAENVWEYESSLYDESIHNWRDLRYVGQGIAMGDSVAWCHGAAGILLSRIECYRIVKDLKWKQRMRDDSVRAYEKLRGYWKRDSWCLCHGIYGNLWILKSGAKVLEEEMNIKMDYNVKLLPQETLNPGLLNGYGGILYYLLCEEKEEFPGILGIID